jgi:hypothetical protein
VPSEWVPVMNYPSATASWYGWLVSLVLGTLVGEGVEAAEPVVGVGLLYWT